MSELRPRIEELPYFEDSAALFMPWADRRWSAFLDSSFPHCHQGRYDIIAADPWCTLVTRGNLTEIRADGQIRLSPEDPFRLLRDCLGPAIPHDFELPFCGGAIGYFGYDLGRRLEALPEQAADDVGVPDMVVGLYDWAVVVDHLQRRSWLVGLDRNPTTASRWPYLVRSFSQIQTIGWQRSDFRICSEILPGMSKSHYAQSFAKIQQYIRNGDCYQVNLTQRFSAYCEGNSWTAYELLRQINPAPFSAYLHYPQLEILSSSPERFLKASDGLVETKPIKGTRPRHDDPLRDQEQSAELRASAKDRAENLMIVDLLRNDIGKSCVPGTVRVPELFAVESYATVHHLVSTVRATLREDLHVLDLLRGCFPGGSITGTPKIRSMQIIEELEPSRRGVYCGSIGYVGYDGNMDSNIAIRTLTRADNHIHFSAGGGIVADSELDSEYQECYHKAAALLLLLDRFRIRRTGHHVGR